MTHEETLRTARQRIALALTSALAPVFGWLYAGEGGAIWAFAAWIVFVVLPRTAGVRLFGFLYASFFTAEQLPWTMINLTLAILIGCLQYGIDVAFYAALIGVPIVVLTLIVIALDLDTAAEAEAALAPAPAGQGPVRKPEQERMAA
ncbi:hypothetical protein DK26_21505 [Bosea sp. WAO]|uniref:hypothetical protein n=1 Tax=Bosea sp. WAO TaxID=406341 RepID=UPI00074766CB|nr:hypothetical protein [Bosea sp. WAO]KUL93853.1 hypothetical protein DK26_21505 [Bosea sp. WAO]